MQKNIMGLLFYSAFAVASCAYVVKDQQIGLDFRYKSETRIGISDDSGDSFPVRRAHDSQSCFIYTDRDNNGTFEKETDLFLEQCRDITFGCSNKEKSDLPPCLDLIVLGASTSGAPMEIILRAGVKGEKYILHPQK